MRRQVLWSDCVRAVSSGFSASSRVGGSLLSLVKKQHDARLVPGHGKPIKNDGQQTNNITSSSGMRLQCLFMMHDIANPYPPCFRMRVISYPSFHYKAGPGTPVMAQRCSSQRLPFPRGFMELHTGIESKFARVHTMRSSGSIAQLS